MATVRETRVPPIQWRAAGAIAGLVVGGTLGQFISAARLGRCSHDVQCREECRTGQDGRLP
jgi:hypothetical protein